MKVWWVSIVFATAAVAQNTSSVSLSFTGTGSGDNTGFSLSGAGTMSPFGSAAVSMGGGNYGIGFTFTFNDGDTLMASGTYTTAPDALSGNANVSGGTGAFAGATGSFSFLGTAPPGTTAVFIQFTLTGSGTIVTSSTSTGTGPPTTAGPGGGAGYPIAGTGGSGSPVSGSGGGGEVACGSTNGGASGTCGTVGFEGSGNSGSSVLVFDGSGGSGSSVLTFEGSGGSGSSVLTFDGSGGSVLVFDGSGSSGSSVMAFGAPDSPVQPHLADSSASASLYITTPVQSSAATYAATADCPATPGSCWISIPAGASGSIAADSRAAVPVTVSRPVPTMGTSNVPFGTFDGYMRITITPAVGQPSTVTAPITAIVPSPAPLLALSQAGLQFQAVAGSATQLGQYLSVSDPGAGALSFSATASTLTGGNWLTVSPTSGSASSTTPAIVNVQANPAGLAAGQYFGLVNFTAAGAVDAPQAVEVVLTILAPTVSNGPLVSPAALTFVASGSTAPAAQAVQFTNLSSQSLTVTATPEFQTGGGWFTATPSSSTVAAGQALTETVTVKTAGLAAGQYYGTLDLHVTQLNADYSVAVTLVVPAAVSTSLLAHTAQAAAASCTPTRLLPEFTNLESGFQTAAGLPVPVQALVLDDCGNPLTSGSVEAYFSGGDTPAPLASLGNGQWTGAWMPHNLAGGAASVGVIATSFSPALYGSAGVNGTLTANSTTPLISSGGVVSTASVAAGAPLPLAPGSFISIFGSNFAAGSNTSNANPYPMELGGVQVTLGGEALPLQFAGNGQINAIVPYDAVLNAMGQVMVELNGSAYSMPETVLVAEAQPTVFTQNQSGAGAGAIQTVKADGTVSLNTPAAPASAGDALVIYCTGLGAVSPPVPTGAAAPLTSLSYTVNTVTVTVGGQNAPVSFAGLAPGYIGLYQVNVTVPAGITPSSSVPVVLTAVGAQSPPVTVAIQ